MLKHIFVLFFNQRKKYTGILVGQMLVFVVLLYCLMAVFEAIQRYYMPGMLETDNVVYFSNFRRGARGVIDGNYSDDEKINSLCKRLEACSMVEAVARTRFFVPYLEEERNYFWSSVKVGGNEIDVGIKCAEEKAMLVFRPVLEEGHWVEEKNLEDGSIPVVVTRQLVEKAGWVNALGKKIYGFGGEFTVVGVIAGLKNHPLSQPRPILIFPYSFRSNDRGCCVRVKAGEMDNFRDYLYREFYKIFEKGKDGLTVVDLEKLKRVRLRPDFLMLISLLVPTGFLLVFAFMGTFGIFWLYSTKRRKEFALRLVVGSTSRNLFRFIILESILLTMMALVPGCILFCWVYSFSTVNLMALGTAAGVMMLFSVFSAWWPAYQVSKVNPIEAMREE
ncbi:ABC transporter permease [Butyricimonas muris]|uniref:ABC transporter permease n=1 Tax=Butyricimonas muris TaxID=3378067 RepID=UPI0039675C66